MPHKGQQTIPVRVVCLHTLAALLPFPPQEVRLCPERGRTLTPQLELRNTEAGKGLSAGLRPWQRFPKPNSHPEKLVTVELTSYGWKTPETLGLSGAVAGGMRRIAVREPCWQVQ